MAHGINQAKILFAGDNFYSAFPNLYAIRGRAYRNVLNWSESVASMTEFSPRRLVPGHTMPILEEATAAAALKDYSEAIRSVYDQTVKGINDGKRELARETKIKALRALGAREYNAPNRNYYLSYANELESGQLSELWF